MAMRAALFVLAEGAARPSANALGYPSGNRIGWLGQHGDELYSFHAVVLAAMRNFVGDRDDITARQKPGSCSS